MTSNPTRARYVVTAFAVALAAITYIDRVAISVSAPFISKDLGLSLNYALHPSVLLKLEGHTNDGLLREDRPLDICGSPSKTRYLIASVVASF